MHNYTVWDAERGRPYRTRLTYAVACLLAEQMEKRFHTSFFVLNLGA